MNFGKFRAAIVAATIMTATVFAHLPSANDARVINEARMMNEMRANQRGARSEAPCGGQTIYASATQWSPTKEYRGCWQIGQGDTVWHGEFQGRRLYWRARFAADASTVPGEFAAEGGTSPWALINSLSAVENTSNPGRPTFQAVTWRGENGATALNNISANTARVPTWRDAASGAYSITLDDIGAMPFDKAIQPAWDLLQDSRFTDIKMAWGVFVRRMTDQDWRHAINMVKQGQEMFNHSMDHTSAADQWQIYWPGDVVSQTDPAVPPSVRGLEVVGTWRVRARANNGTLIGHQGATGTAQNPPPPFDFGPSGFTGTLPSMTEIAARTASHFGNPATHFPDNWQNLPTATPWIDEATDGGFPMTVIAESDMVTIEWPAYWTGYDPAAGIAWNDPRIKITPKASYNGIPIQAVELAGGQKVYVAYTKFDAGATEFIGHQEGYIAATGVQWFEDGMIHERFPHFYNGARIGEAWGPEPPGAPIQVGTCQATNTNGCPTTGLPGWFVTTRDQGRPGFVAKLFCVEGWDAGNTTANRPQTRRNVDEANTIINKNIYERIVSAGEYFAKGKRSEYFGYPFDAYSETTHDYLWQTGEFVGARGGAKSGMAMPGDFFHPFRIDFDAFYINDNTWTPATSHLPQFKVPFNAHVLLGINELVDDIVANNGYMIRELHSVADMPGNTWFNTDVPDLWPINNNGLNQGGWWGGITKQQMEGHFTHVMSLVNDNKLTVLTPSEAVKYRMTRNAFETDANLTPNGQNWNLKLNQRSGAAGDVAPIHQDEISVIVNLGTPVTSLAVSYDGSVDNTSPDNSPRRKPRKMDNAGQIWSVSINPFAAKDFTALLVKDGEWRGQGVVGGGNIDDPFEQPPVGISNRTDTQRVRMSFAGIRNGQIALNLRAGNYTANLYNVQGRLISSVNINALDGVNITNLKTNNLAKGIFVLNVRDARGANVVQHKLMVR